MDEFERVPIITKEGPIFGFVEITEQGTYYRFKGIPYAKPPVGDLRFLPPVRCPPWTEERNCTKEGAHCWQIQGSQTSLGSEDCLYINVGTKLLNPEKPLPVMVWVGGYNFCGTFDTILDPTILMDENIVFVSFNFRLGPFGFLSINDVSAPGNAGLKDAVMALQWVQRNISLFGGDADNVTLFGSSSGGAMVHFMLLSSMATGLFHKVVLQSASALNNWALVKNPSQPVAELAQQLGISARSNMEIVETLKSMPAEAIMEAFVQMQVRKFAHETDILDSMFRPCIELEFEGQQAFLTKSPPLILKSGKFNKVPMIIGSNSVEASLIQSFRDDFYKNYEMYNAHPSLLVPRALAAQADKANTVGQQLLEFYIGEEEMLRDDTQHQYLQLISDYYFLYYVNKSVRFHSEYAPDCPVYYYIMNYCGDWSVSEEFNFFNTMGHCAEIPYLFRIQLPRRPACSGGRDSVKVRARVVRMWTNFAKHSNPTPDDNDPLLQITWDPVESADRLSYLSIGSELTKGRNPFHDRMRFWDKLHDEHKLLRAMVFMSDMGVSW